jgi:hypothetical protein
MPPGTGDHGRPSRVRKAWVAATTRYPEWADAWNRKLLDPIDDRRRVAVELDEHAVLIGDLTPGTIT